MRRFFDICIGVFQHHLTLSAVCASTAMCVAISVWQHAPWMGLWHGSTLGHLTLASSLHLSWQHPCVITIKNDLGNILDHLFDLGSILDLHWLWQDRLIGCIILYNNIGDATSGS